MIMYVMFNLYVDVCNRSKILGTVLNFKYATYLNIFYLISLELANWNPL